MDGIRRWFRQGEGSSPPVRIAKIAGVMCTCQTWQSRGLLPIRSPAERRAPRRERGGGRDRSIIVAPFAAVPVAPLFFRRRVAELARLADAFPAIGLLPFD
jgi:hypothetical protein